MGLTGLALGAMLPRTATAAEGWPHFQPKAKRVEAWRRLAQDLDFNLLPLISHEIGLSEAIEAAPRQIASML